MEIIIKNGKFLVSPEDYKFFSELSCYLNNSYIKANIQKKNWTIHRYIMIVILNNTHLTKDDYVDHINNNKLDNRRENLRIVTKSENAMNKIKRNNTSSIYYGVSKYKDNFYKVSIYINKKKLSAYYDNEQWAAYQWNIWIDKYELKFYNKNDIIKPLNFKEYVKKEKNTPKYIKITKNNTYQVNYKNNYIGTYKTLNESEKELDNFIKLFNNIKINEIKNEPMIKNDNNEAIIILYNKKKEKIAETIVDDDMYYKLMEFKWSYGNNKVQGYINNTKVSMHRYIMDYNGLNVIDHINNNPLDNRKCNLRIVTLHQNGMNKKKTSKPTSSQYIGVTWTKRNNKWASYIKINNKNKHLGYFINEIDAAKKRDEMALFYFKEYSNLNFPINS